MSTKLLALFFMLKKDTKIYYIKCIFFFQPEILSINKLLYNTRIY